MVVIVMYICEASINIVIELYRFVLAIVAYVVYSFN